MAFKKRKQRTYDEASLYEYAIGALGRRMRSVAEIKRLMRERVRLQEDGDALIEKVVARLKDDRYLNDANYAASYSSFRKENEKFGRARVVQDLKARGVHGDVIDAAISTAYGETNEEELARDFLRRKRLKKPTNQKEAARVFRTLARAGHSTRVIVRILKKWDVEDEVLTELESEASDQ
jgi:regulatory protein